LANFNTHFTVATASAALLSTLSLKVGYVGVEDALFMTGACMLGGILPDIDLKYSHPAKLMFSLLGILTALFFMFSSEWNISILELWVVGLAIFLCVRYPLWMIFHRFAVHRGAIHSVLAALLAAFSTSALLHQFLTKPAFVSWLTGFAMFVGFMIHLTLDEVYSVDFMNSRVKRSFGTALKLIDLKHLVGSCCLIIGCLVTWFYTPSAIEFWQILSTHETQQMLFKRLVPSWLLEIAARAGDV